MPSSTAMSGMMSSGGMSFNAANFATTLYSTGWMPTTPAAYAGSWLFLFFLAIIWRGLVLGLHRLERHYVRKLEGYNILVDGGKQQVTRARTVGVWRISVNLPKALLAAVNQAIAYLLFVFVPEEPYSERTNDNQG
jgi:hypothetical protein